MLPAAVAAGGWQRSTGRWRQSRGKWRQAVAGAAKQWRGQQINRSGVRIEVNSETYCIYLLQNTDNFGLILAATFFTQSDCII